MPAAPHTHTHTHTISHAPKLISQSTVHCSVHADNAGELTLFQERLKHSQAVDTSPIHEEAEMPSEQQSPDTTSSVQNDSECAFWVPSDLDSDEAEQMKEEESGSQVREESSDHNMVEEIYQSSSPF